MQLPTQSDIRIQLERWLATAVRAVDPARATRVALDRLPPPQVAPGIIALGKAAAGMASAAIGWLAAHDLEPIGGIVVSDQPVPSLPKSLRAAVGDHPIPGVGSLEAATSLAASIRELPPDAPVHVFLSGGTSSLIAAPVDGIDPEELGQAFALFHRLGLDIVAMNGLRRQLTRWSNGRLAAELGPRPLDVWVISDVIGNDLSAIGSGPLFPAPVGLKNLLAVLANPLVSSGLSPAVQEALRRTPTSAARDIPHHLVADGRTAIAAVAEAARHDGISATLHREAIVGDATNAGAALGEWIHREIRKHQLPDRDSGILVEPVPRRGVAHVWISETTVELPASPGAGGRAQQFALATAQAIGDLDWPDAVTVMVAATDGRDGPTDAAGAIVNAGTPGELRAAGIAVDQALATCNAHPALDRVGALLRTGRTGTNVADIVVVWMWNWY
jgi:glycerate 2-kinase